MKSSSSSSLAFVVALFCMVVVFTEAAWSSDSHQLAPSAALKHEIPAEQPTAMIPQNRRLLQADAGDVCSTPPTCDPSTVYVECTNGGRISCQCSWISRCKPTASGCFLHTSDKDFTSCGF